MPISFLKKEYSQSNIRTKKESYIFSEIFHVKIGSFKNPHNPGSFKQSLFLKMKAVLLPIKVKVHKLLQAWNRL